MHPCPSHCFLPIVVWQKDLASVIQLTVNGTTVPQFCFALQTYQCCRVTFFSEATAVQLISKTSATRMAQVPIWCDSGITHL